VRGFLAGVIVLVGMEVVLHTADSASRFGQIFTSIGTIAQHILDPSIPAIPDLTGS
jgi:hypothetical protein